MSYIRKSKSRGNVYYQFVGDDGRITQLGNRDKLGELAQLVRLIHKMDGVTVSKLNQFLRGLMAKGLSLDEY